MRLRPAFLAAFFFGFMAADVPLAVLAGAREAGEEAKRAAKSLYRLMRRQARRKIEAWQT